MSILDRIIEYSNISKPSAQDGGRTGFKVGTEVIRTLDDGREYTVTPGRKRIIDADDIELIKEWRESLTDKNPIQFKKFLRNKFDDKTAVSIATRIRNNKNIEFNPTEEFEVGFKQGKKNKRLDAIQKLVDKHNNSETMLYRKEDIYNKLGVKRLTAQDNPNEVALLNQMDKPEDKIKKAFDKIITKDVKLYNPKVTGNIEDYNIIYKMISDTVTPKNGSKRFKADASFIKKTLSTHKPYLDIKENFDYFAKNAKSYVGQTFQEAFERAKFLKGGVDLKNVQGLKPNYSKPEQNIYNFALRHGLLNQKRGTPSEIQFYKFNKKGQPIGEPLDFDKLPRDMKKASRIFDGNKYGFTYKGQFFNKDTLRTKGYNSGLFNDVYKMTRAGAKLVPDPNDPGKKITLQQLLKDTGDKLTIGHSDKTGGVAGKNPFSNLRVESGKFNLAMYYAYNKVEDPKLRKMIINNLQEDFGSLKGPAYEEAFIKNKSDLAKAMFETPEAVLEQPSYYRSAGQKVIKDLREDFFKQSPKFKKETYRVSGLGSEENAKNFLQKITSYSKLPQCKVGMAEGGRIGFALSDECIRDGLIEQKKLAASGNKKAAQELVDVAKVASRGGLLKNVLGPGAILGEAVFEGAIIGNKVLGGKPLNQAWAESYLSYLDPRKYKGELDSMLMERDRMLQSTADKNILRSGFSAQDQLSAFNKAIEERDLAKSRGRIDQYLPAAAEAREQGRLAGQSADVISSEAFKDATKVAQEYLQGQSGKQQADFGVLSVAQGDDPINLRRLKAMRKMKNLYTQYSDKDLIKMLQDAGYNPQDIIDLKTTERLTPSFARTLGGLDVLRSQFQEQEAMQRIADAGGVANLAGGGIAKLAGVSKGPPPESGPNPQGLNYLIKRVTNS
jgi:hypothetical protein